MQKLIKPITTKRAAKSFRRKQLIEATISSIAIRGLGDTTLSHISQSVGLSQGMVNLHFTSKENLLNETLNFLRDEYEQTLQTAMAKAAKDPASQLAALLKADYKTTVTNPKKLAVWFAFWGEVKSRPTYQKTCQDRVTEYSKILEGALADLIQDGKYKKLNVVTLAEGITAMADGLWLNLLISAGSLKRKDAEKIMMQYMAQIFPKHAGAFS